jgi:hypothetical protein
MTTFTPSPACLEVVRFRLLPAVSDEAFLTVNAPTAEFLRQQQGFCRRVLSRSTDGTWTDIVEWESHALARKAADQLTLEPSLVPFMKAMDPESVVMDHLDIAMQMA